MIFDYKFVSDGGSDFTVFIQLILVFILFFFILLSIWAFIGFSMMNNEVVQDLFKADSTFLSD
ncbi:MAG TPA: hypothetical protein DEO65_05660 [Bacillus bacterium]|nr:hypothetical protein [Bacillus sp. (in: firmicutes)]